MILQPSCSQIIELIRAELQDVVRPTVSSAGAATSLQMIDSLLRSVAIRVENEAAWMRQEVGDILRVSALVIPRHAEADHSSERLSQLHQRLLSIGGADAYDLTTAYALASELLTGLLGSTQRSSPVLRRRVVELLEQRTTRELEIVGPLSLPGRT